jgi:hypothetical protein
MTGQVQVNTSTTLGFLIDMFARRSDPSKKKGDIPSATVKGVCSLSGGRETLELTETPFLANLASNECLSLGK